MRCLLYKDLFGKVLDQCRHGVDDLGDGNKCKARSLEKEDKEHTLTNPSVESRL